VVLLRHLPRVLRDHTKSTSCHYNTILHCPSYLLP
jgi:hypothetical protein